MKKRDFIRALYRACPAFRRDLESLLSVGLVFDGITLDPNASFETFLHPLALKLENEDETSEEISENNEPQVTWDDFYNKWPRAREMMVSPSEIKSSSKLNVQDFEKLLELEQIVIDPWPIYRQTAPAKIGEGFIPDCFVNNSPEKDEEIKKELRRSVGEELFSKAAIVLPIYPETTKDDINWEYIEKLKKHFYGYSYRPKRKQYEKAIKVFERGQLLEDGKGYKSWQEVADSICLQLSTVRYIYTRAHEIVYGVLPKKRHYGTEEEITIPKSSETGPEDPGPKLKERLLNSDKEIGSYNTEGAADDEMGSFKVLFEETDQEDDDQEEFDPEKCSKCHRFVARSSGKYSPNPDRPGDDVFLCKDCLSPSD